MAVYLQDHSRDFGALRLVPGSHNVSRVPEKNVQGAAYLHPREGAAVIFDQRVTHRGQGKVPLRLARARSSS